MATEHRIFGIAHGGDFTSDSIAKEFLELHEYDITCVESKNLFNYLENLKDCLVNALKKIEQYREGH